MPRYNEDEDDWDVDEFDADEDVDTIPCPHCRREIHEEAECCPHCQQYLSDEDAPPTRKPWWIYLGVVACLYIVYRSIVGW